jgi:hypothetical protein
MSGQSSGACFFILDRTSQTLGEQAIIRDLHEPVVDAVVRHVHYAYTDTIPGLPYCEMPVISVTVECIM